jgi:hypothetical protein
MNAVLERKLRDLRSRQAVRAWETRQMRHAKGVWFRLRRVLADAQSAWEIPADEARRLVHDGCAPEPVGTELQPPKTIVFVSRERLETVAARRELTLRLGPELLAPACIALVRFP